MGKIDDKRAEKIRLDLQVDENNLDREWLGQPTLYFSYAAKLADAQRDLDMARNRLSVAKAEADQSIRRDPKLYGMEKVTEASVASAVAAEEGCVNAAELVAAARHRVDVFQAAVDALQHRRKALESLVTLFMANYYSKPRASGEAKEKMEHVEQRQTFRRGVRRDNR